jgi:hypothetical protein
VSEVAMQTHRIRVARAETCAYGGWR